MLPRYDAEDVEPSSTNINQNSTVDMSALINSVSGCSKSGENGSMKFDYVPSQSLLID